MNSEKGSHIYDSPRQLKKSSNDGRQASIPMLVGIQGFYGCITNVVTNELYRERIRCGSLKSNVFEFMCSEIYCSAGCLGGGTTCNFINDLSL